MYMDAYIQIIKKIERPVFGLFGGSDLHYTLATKYLNFKFHSSKYSTPEAESYVV